MRTANANSLKTQAWRKPRPLYYGKDFSATPKIKSFTNKIIEGFERSRLIAEVNYQVGFRDAKKRHSKVINMCDRANATGEDVYVKEVSNYMGEIVKRKEIKAEQIVDELAKIAFTKTGTPFMKEGDTDANLKVNVKDKLKALDMLAKWLGLYEKDNKQKAASTQLLQIAFIGADKVAQVQEQTKQINEFNKTKSIWDKSMKKKSVKVAKKLSEFSNSAQNIIEAEIEKIETPRENIEKVAESKLQPRQRLSDLD